MVITDNQLIGNQSYSNGSTVILEKRTGQAKAALESSVSEKQDSRNSTNDIAVIYEKSDPSNLKIVTYAKPSAVKTMELSKSSIKDVQTKLNAIGYSCGTPDGIAGKNTKAAVTSFQKLCGLKNQSGNITNETITKLNSVYNRSQKGVLSRGLRNNVSVKKLQENLNKLNFNCGTPDGTFGTGTETAVIEFQKKYGLTTDGIAGNDTLNKIKEALSNIGNSDTKNTESGTIRNVPINNNYINKNVNVDNAKYVYNELIKAGFSKESVAAVMGNLDVEHSFSTSWEGDQGSVGIAQWRGGRKTNLEKYANEHNGEVTDIKIQTSFMINGDMENRLGKEGLGKFKKMTDYIDATDYFCDKFESPSSYKNRDEWLNGKYGPNYAQHGGTYQIKWERYEWSEQLQKYELDLKNRRSAAKYWYNNMK